MFGPISYVVPVSSAAAGLDLLVEAAREHGAITAGVHARDRSVLESAERAAVAAGVPLSCNLTGQIWVNQAAAFSDYHVSGLNPAGNSTLCDAAFVATRFHVVQSREPHVEE